MTISNEAVEAAAKAYRDEFPYDENEGYIVKLALEAAAPFIRAQALEEAADHLMRVGWNNACTAHLRARAAEMRQP